MNKNTLYTGLVYTAVGAALFLIALLGEYTYEALLWGFGGGSLGSGLSLLWRYYYWTRPERTEAYQERLQTERIESRDERNITLRDKSGRITNTIMLLTFTALCCIFSILTVFGVMMPCSRYLVITFALLIFLQLFCGTIVLNYLSKRL